MSSLNRVIYRQSCSDRDDRSFVFVLAVQATERLPLYGVCVYVDEFVFLPPPISGEAVAATRLGLSRHVVAAPRCYCLLSHYPFFPLHFQVGLTPTRPTLCRRAMTPLLAHMHNTLLRTTGAATDAEPGPPRAHKAPGA